MSFGNSEQQGVPMMKFSTPPVDRPRWLWPNRIPLGCLTLLAGEPKVGKSYLTLDLAARVSRGGPWPEEGAGGQAAGTKQLGPGSVLMFSIEDSWHDTVRPRLDALGADLSKFRPLSLGLGLTADMRMEWLLENLYRLNDCRLIVIDPISAFLNELEGNRGSQGRRLVDSLAECVRGRSIALVLVTHWRGGKGKALHRPSGNDAMVRAARSVWLLANDEAEPDRRLLVPIKHNLGPPPSGLAFKFESVGDGQYARLQWEAEPVLVSTDDLLREDAGQTRTRDRVLCQAVEWLKEMLKDGRSVPAAEVQEIAKARGISYGTLRRAFRELECESVPPRPGEPRQFVWRINRKETTD